MASRHAAHVPLVMLLGTRHLSRQGWVWVGWTHPPGWQAGSPWFAQDSAVGTIYIQKSALPRLCGRRRCWEQRKPNPENQHFRGVVPCWQRPGVPYSGGGQGVHTQHTADWRAPRSAVATHGGAFFAHKTVKSTPSATPSPLRCRGSSERWPRPRAPAADPCTLP